MLLSIDNFYSNTGIFPSCIEKELELTGKKKNVKYNETFLEIDVIL